MKVLIVDDEKYSRLLLEEILEEIGIEEIEQIGNGLHVIRKIKEENYDVVFLDYHLPIISGKQILQGIIDEGLPCFVIWVTGSIHLTDKELNLVQVKGWLNKPFSKKQVKSVMDELKEVLL